MIRQEPPKTRRSGGLGVGGITCIMLYVYTTLNLHAHYYVKYRKTKKVAIAMHCNLRSPDVAPVILGFN